MTKTEAPLQAMAQDIAILKERVENVRGEIAGIEEMTKQIALLQQRVDDMRKGWEVWAQRLWMILAPAAALVVGYFLKK